MRALRPGMALLGCGLLLAGVTASHSATTGQGVSFARDVQPIFAARCAMCHHAQDHMGELVLQEPMAYDQIVGVPATELPRMMRVAPGRPDRSYLMLKLKNKHVEAGGVGWNMPPPSNPLIQLSKKDQGVIETWISAGAPNN